MVSIGKLPTGQFVIGKLKSDMLEDVYLLNLIPNEPPPHTTSISVEFMPFYFPISTEKVNIETMRLLCDPVPADSNLTKRYNDMVSPIKVVSNSNVLDLSKRLDGPFRRS